MFDFGDLSVAEVLTDACTATIPGSERTWFRCGDRVKARFMQVHWYLATIEEDNGDGTYKLLWDDGDGHDRIKRPDEMKLIPQECPTEHLQNLNEKGPKCEMEDESSDCGEQEIEDPDAISVVLHVLSGCELKLQMDRQSKILELKQELEKQYKLPFIFQKLIIGTSVLLDKQKLADLCKPDTTTLSITLLITIEQVREDLLDFKHSHKQLQTLGRLHDWSTTDTSGLALTTMNSFVGRDATVKVQSMSASEEGKEHVVTCLRDSDPFVRCIALKILPTVLAKGKGRDEQLIELVCTSLEDPYLCVRDTARITLHQELERWNAKARSAVILLLDHPLADVRVSALMVFSEPSWVEKGNRRVIDAVILCVRDPYKNVRRAAVGALFCVAETNDSIITHVLCESLRDTDTSVRDAAMVALLSCTKKGNKEIIYAVVCCLEHPDAGVRRSALRVLNEVTVKGDDYAISCIYDKISNANEDIASTAIEALLAVSKLDDKTKRRLAHLDRASIGRLVLAYQAYQ